MSESTLPDNATPSQPPAPLADPKRSFDPAPTLDPALSLDPAIAARLKRDAAGLVPAVVQEEATGAVLMVGWMDDEALRLTLTTGRSTFFSRSRNEHWVKGETSGHAQWVREVRLDCDGDTLLLKVRQEGPACHTGDRTCFDAQLLAAVVNDPVLAQGRSSGPEPASERQESSAQISTAPMSTAPMSTAPMSTAPMSTVASGAVR